MAPMSVPSLGMSDPPWPPDLCFVSRDVGSPASHLISMSALHPEISPLLPSPPSLPASAHPTSPPLPPAEIMGPSSSPPAASWVSKLSSSAHNLKKMAPPTFTDDGTPVVKAPDSVILKSSINWKGYLVAQFHGNAPSPTKVFADLNPIWGKQGRIRVRHHSKNVCLIFIPCEIIRKWVLDVGLWHSDKCAFSVFEWTPNINLAPMRLEYAPVWVLFRGIPQELWSQECFSTFATGVGIPVQSEFPKLPPFSNGVVKLRVIIKLAAKRASSVKVVDKLGNSVFISAEYLKAPHKCEICSEFGHSELRCPDRQSPVLDLDKAAPSVIPAVPAIVPAASANVTAPMRTSTEKSPAPASVAVAPAGSSNARAQEGVASTQTSTPRPLSISADRTLCRSLSLSNEKLGPSRLSGGSLEWVPVVHRSTPVRARNSPSPPASVRPVTSAQFDSEEELISAAQSILRKRIASAEAELPPFSTEKDRRKVRRQQREAMLKICDSLDDASPTHSKIHAASVIPRTVQRKSSPNGKSSSFLEA